MRAQAAHSLHVHAHSLPTPSHGPHSRGPCHALAFQHVTTCRACVPGAQWRPVISPLNCSVLSWRPKHPGQLKPTTLPLRRLAPNSCSVGLSPTLSLPFSPALSPAPHSLSLSLCLSSLFLSHCLLSLSLSLSRIKGGFGTFGVSLSPRGSNHPLQDRRGVVYPLGYDDWVTAPLVPIFPTPPCVSSPVMCISFRMGVCSAACRGTAQRPRVPGPPASRAFSGTAARGPLGLPATHACSFQFCSPRRAPLCVPLPSDGGGSPPTGTGATCLHFSVATGPACSPEPESSGSS